VQLKRFAEISGENKKKVFVFERGSLVLSLRKIETQDIEIENIAVSGVTKKTLV
jgi:hypothetical protein